MATQLQLRRGNTAQTAVFTGAIAEVTVDTDQKTVVVHDGTTVGGTYIITKSQLESNVSIIAGINSTQNTNITAVNNFAASSYNQANTATTTAQGANGLAQAAFNKANTGGTFTGSVTINQDLTVSGNVNITGNVISHGANDLIINDPLIYIANNNLGNLVDIGIVGNFNNGIEQHTGIVRDASDGVWKLFSNVVAEPTTTVDFTYATWDNLKVGSIEINDSIIRSNTANLILSTPSQIIDSFDSRVYRTAKYIIQAINVSEVHSTEVLLNHNDTDVFLYQYNSVGSNTSLFTVSSSLTANTVSLQVNPANPNTVFDVVRTSIVARTLSGLEGDLMLQSGSEDLNDGSGTEDLNI